MNAISKIQANTELAVSAKAAFPATGQYLTDRLKKS